ncbi:N-acetylglucosamine 6-phosphate deacetylase [Bifidobacterium bohemicum]|uniref:N-acetylglucosamine-6-phosphate deacetylase n=2 Tax=Bifidobacterium bohemicum TaxID=638617 RepID=A0A086ZKA2_9BIFI|nr:N-acetylglucosamine-6-phosphate deacetylase [Bifidobacterium bohemicum DSM 22767]SCB86039.1 N-acetylglucosamine 6-phosphate deacetylase [Bifidobacterium bohemicum]
MSDQVMNGRVQTVEQVTKVVTSGPDPWIVVRNARKVDARGIEQDFWVIAHDGVIAATGCGDEALASVYCVFGIEDGAAGMPSGRKGLAEGEGHDKGDERAGIAMSTLRASDGAPVEVVDAAGRNLTPGYVDIHAHGAWGMSFDDGVEGIGTARAGHMMHGTTRQVLSLITNPMDVICDNLKTVRSQMDRRPDVLGAHLEGPFLALSRKGAHDPNCLKDPTDDSVDQLLEAGDGSIRQITIAPELPHGVSAIRRFAAAGVVPAVGHCDADYETARRGFESGAGIMTHMFNAMNGLHHREPGPIPAAVEDPRVTIELINDGFHVQNPVLKMALNFAPHRIAFVTDAMSATDCPDGPYKLGALDVTVKDGHARLVSNGAIAGSTLLLEKAVQRAITVLGISPADAVEAATLTPAHAFGFDRSNPVTGAPIGLLSPGYAADLLLSDPETWRVERVWCAGRIVR